MVEKCKFIAHINAHNTIVLYYMVVFILLLIKGYYYSLISTAMQTNVDEND